MIEESNPFKEKRIHDGIHVMAVNDKTKDGKSVKYYIGKYLGIKNDDLIKEAIRSMPVLFDSIGIYANTTEYQRATNALNNGYISIEDYENDCTEIIQLFPATLERLLMNHPSMKPLLVKYINYLTPSETPSISKEESMETYTLIVNILKRDFGQKEITQIPVKSIPTVYQLKMKISVHDKALVGFLPRAIFMDIIKKEKPEMLLERKELESKVVVLDKHAQMIIDLW